MDIAALTLKKISQIIVLATADSEFIPAMKLPVAWAPTPGLLQVA